MNASPPVPPNWDEFLNAALQSVTPYHKLELQPTTTEFQVISQMVNVPIFKLERVLNTSLWKKFVNERKELLTRKSEDLQLLTTLGLTEQEMLRRAHINVNFSSDRSVSDIKYDDNIALLFHGSRSNLDTVLTQGLDDRLGNGGTHGKGIYFSDSAHTSVGFDSNGALLIVAVLLGDCYSVDNLGRQRFVREPEKAQGQKRNQEDLFFDSIVAKRGDAQGGSNEFIIFNRNQCCPLYVVTHGRGTSASASTGNAFLRNMFAPPPPPPTVPTILGVPAPFPQASRPNPNNFFNLGMLWTGPPPTRQQPFSQPPPAGAGRASGLPGSRTVAASRRPFNTYAGGNTAPVPAAVPRLPYGVAAPSQNGPAILPFQSAEFSQARNSLPPFVWTQRNGGGRLLPNHNQWPFLARTLFDLMMNDEVDLTRRHASTTITPAAAVAMQPIDKGERALKISKLVELGFGDVDKNARVLEMFEFNLEATIDHMLTSQPVPPAPGPSGGGAAVAVEEWEDASHLTAQAWPTFTLADFVADDLFDVSDMCSEITEQSGVPADPAVPVPGSNSELSLQGPAGASSAQVSQGDQATMTMTANQLNSPAQSATSVSSVIMTHFEDCLICCTEYPSDSPDWRPLGCGHKLCSSCYSRLETRGTTMSGQSHVFLKCPFCQACSGQQIGDCPTGRMNVSQSASSLPGYEQYGTQVLMYSVHSSQHHLSRTGYLPSSPEGLRLVGLLRTAWDRRLIFTIGNSLTTGAQNTLVWNIHHKTSTHGSVQSHGYPDPTYLERLRDELKQYGIE